MITVIRTVSAFPGMTGEAISWAKEVAALVERGTGKEQSVGSAFGGMLAEIGWIGHYDSIRQCGLKCGPKCSAMGSIEQLLRKPETCLCRVASAIRFGNTNRACRTERSSALMMVNFSGQSSTSRSGATC